MKRYVFRAEKVLRIRRLQEDIARAAVVDARRAEAAAHVALDVSHQRYRELSTDAAPQSSAAFLMAREQAGHRAGALTVARQRHDAAEQDTATALGTWRDANSRVQGLERLDDRRRGEHHVEVRRDEDAQADEIVVSRARRAS